MMICQTDQMIRSSSVSAVVHKLKHHIKEGFMVLFFLSIFMGEILD